MNIYQHINSFYLNIKKNSYTRGTIYLFIYLLLWEWRCASALLNYTKSAKRQKREKKENTKFFFFKVLHRQG